MSIIARPDQVPPPWASSRIKLNQMFYQNGFDPPADLIETASFLVTITFVRQRPAIGFVAHHVARYLEKEKLAKVLRVAVPMELPPVGLITMRGRLRTPASQQMMDCLRKAAMGERP